MAQSYQVDIVTRVVGAGKIAQLEAALDKLAKNASKADRKSDEVAESLRRLQRAAQQSAAAANKKQKSLKNLGSSLQSLATKVTTAYGAFRLFNQAIASAGARDAAEQRLKNLTSSTGEYETALLAAKVASQRFGQTQTEATKAFADTLSRLKGLGYGLAEVNDIYTGFNTIARQAGVATQDAAGAFLQLSQALGSGTLQGDELRSILERMPQLGVEIRNALGPEGASGSIKELASSGKLTGDVILKAMQNAAKGADDLDSKITSQQLTMERAKQAADQFFVAMGKAFAPAFLAVVEQLTFALGFVGSLLTQAATAAANNAEAIGAFAVNALRLGAVVGVIISVVKGVQLIKKALDAAKAAQIAFMALAGPKAWAVIAAGIGVAAATTYGLAKANEAVDKAMEDAMAQAKLQGEEAVKTLQEQIELYRTQNGLGQQNKVTKEQEAAATKALAAAQREYQAALGGEQADIDRELQVTQAILNAEKQINDAKLQQANADLQAATNQAEREAAAQRIYDLTISNAQLEYEATIAAANAEMQKVEAALKHATMLEKQIKAEVSLAQSKGIYNDQQQEALDNANALVQEAEKNLQAQDQINQSIEAGAAAQLDAKQKAALTAMEANRIKQETDGAVASANNLAAAYDRAAGAANNAAAAANAAAAGGFSGGVGGSGDGTKQWTNAYKPIVTKKLDAEGNIVDKTEKEIEREKNALKLQGWKGGILEVKDGGADTFAAAAFNASWFAAGLTAGDASRQANNLRKYGGMVGPKGSIVDMEYRRMTGEYAEGGYVTGPTNALIGEGGEPEYIIPQSKMDSAMQRYGSGMRGSSVIPDNANVSINYSGSTVDMGGTSYINKGDVNGIVSQAVNATLTTLKKSPKARLEAGMR
jgi:tape measure domain-containing protein